MQPIEYLVAATVVAVRRRATIAALPQTSEDLKDLIEKTFSIKISDVVFRDLILNLRASSLLRVVHDDYAGEIFTILKTRMDKPSGDLAEVLTKAEWGGNSLLGRVFSNDKYWEDLSRFINQQSEVNQEPDGIENSIPASDRLVTLTHNQAVEIEEKTDEIINHVSALNQMDGEPNLRELVLGQLRAGKELIQAGTFRVYALESTLIEGLRFIAKRYEREGVAALAAALIMIIFRHIGIDI